MQVSLTRAELVVVDLPLRIPWSTGLGTVVNKPVVLVHVFTSCGQGWAECAAMPSPDYTGEYVDSAVMVLRDVLIAELIRHGPIEPGRGQLPTSVRGHHMARAALDEAMLDAQLRATDRSLADWLGVTATAVPAGASFGLPASAIGPGSSSSRAASELLESITKAVDDGYRRIRIKVAPGCDTALVAAARRAAPGVELMADANGAYTIEDIVVLTSLDEYGLACIEQPLRPSDLVGHAQLAHQISTPICLDEALESLDALDTALALGACSVVNLKRARVGGMAETVAIHDRCRANGVGLWIGGMLETAVGRAANVALAAMDGCTLIGDISPSSRALADDLADPLVINNGTIAVPSQPGVGPWPDSSRLSALGAVTIAMP